MKFFFRIKLHDGDAIAKYTMGGTFTGQTIPFLKAHQK